MPAEPSVDLTNCDREPIHLPGSIQPHGCMLVCDGTLSKIDRHSANAGAMLGYDAEINGSTIEHVIGAAAAHELRNALAISASPARPAILFGLATQTGALFDVAVHRFKGNTIVEFEPVLTSGERPLELTRALIGRIADIDDVDRLVRDTARLVQGMLGYDRVMIYRFGHDGSGQVVAEVKRPDLESFLGQYFPASDIPQQARALYLRNTIRVISDADCVRVPIVPERDPSGEPVDLSFSHLRSVSPIHCEYLRNMGVGASMSISVIIDGALWGLIACHHYSPRVLSMGKRVAAEMFGEFFSLHLHALRQKRRLETATRARRSLDGVIRLISGSEDIGELLRGHLKDFAALMPCDGVGLWLNGKWSADGVAPPPVAAPALARVMGQVTDGHIWATHMLARHLPDAADYAGAVSGVLAIPLSQVPRDYLFFFRREVTQTLNWAGNPEKSYETGPLGDRLTPRKSFAIWKETVHNQSRPWTDADREIADATRSALVEIVLRHNELMAEERGKADVRQRMLNEELNHRVKNILAVIKSLVGHPIREGRTLAEYVDSLKGRIQSLSVAHDQVVRSGGGGLLIDLLNAELSPYRSAAGRIVLDGPPVWLDARAFSVMALVLHELSTNAAKYGALSQQSGAELRVTWSLGETGDCRLEWSETGVNGVTPPTRSGFGTVLIDRSIPYDLGGSSEMAFTQDGVLARFMLPSKHVRVPISKAPVEQSVTPVVAAEGVLDVASVLIVEDQMLIAIDVEGMLASHGVRDIVTVSSTASALQRLRDFAPDVAILDVNLGAETSLPVAEELTRRGVPFVFATGYADTTMIPPAFKSVTIVRKPYEAAALIAALTSVVAKAREKPL